ncbi:MAG: DUF2934 domain-containing protein [Devosia sp.]|nr:DUF2934 domain-containing protein [Devosia sp.]
MDQVMSVEAYEERIRERAHQLWEAAGQPVGLSDQFWFAAQHEFDAEHPDTAAFYAEGPRPEVPGGHLTGLIGDNS